MLKTIALLAAVTCCHPIAVDRPRRVDAVFVEIDKDRDWKTFFAKNAGREVVVANIYGYGDAPCEPGCPKYEEALKVMVAAPPEMPVYIGLVYDEKFHSPDADESWAADAAKEDIKVAKEFVRQLKQAGSRMPTGWYLAREIYNFRDETAMKAIRKYFEKVSSGLPKGDVLIAPFFLPQTQTCDVMSAEETARTFTELIRETRVKRIMLQDGFAARNSHSVCQTNITFGEYALRAKPYEDAMAGRGQRWVDVEAFDHCESGRLEKQFEILPAHAKVIVYQYDDCVDVNLCQ